MASSSPHPVPGPHPVPAPQPVSSPRPPSAPGRAAAPRRGGILYTLARGVAVLRRGRALHTRGRSFLATFRVIDHPDIYLGIPVLDEPGEHEVPVRLSKGRPCRDGCPTRSAWRSGCPATPLPAAASTCC
nr:hypothetical protein GCM10020093_013250 [Planobispora longispora]